MYHVMCVIYRVNLCSFLTPRPVNGNFAVVQHFLVKALKSLLPLPLNTHSLLGSNTIMYLLSIIIWTIYGTIATKLVSYKPAGYNDAGVVVKEK